MSNSLKIKGPPKVVKDLLSGGSMGVNSTYETKRKVQQEQQGESRRSTANGGRLVAKQGAVTSPTKAGPKPPSRSMPKSLVATAVPTKRANTPSPSGRRDGLGRPGSVSNLLSGGGFHGQPAGTPFKANPPQLRYLRAQQPQSGE